MVAEETGYPTELLDMDLDLEADLGIDTVKQAEVFASIREAYGIEFDESLKLRDYPTLNHVVGFVRDGRTGAPRSRPARPPAAPAAEPRPAASVAEPGPWRLRRRPWRLVDEVAARVLGVVAEETGYPTELLDMDLDLEADLGIDTVKQAEVFASIREAYGIEFDESLQAARLPDAESRGRVRARAAADVGAAARARAGRAGGGSAPAAAEPACRGGGRRRAGARGYPPPRAGGRWCVRRSTSASTPE